MAAKYVWFTCKETSKPILEIFEKPKQIIVRFMPYGSEHITIHEDSKGHFIKNLWSSHSYKSEWEIQSICMAAKMSNYKNWQKHDKYELAELPLVKFLNGNGYHLVTRFINLDSYKPKTRYLKQIHDLDINTVDTEFMISIFLSTSDYACEGNLPKITLNLGSLCIQILDKITG